MVFSQHRRNIFSALAAIIVASLVFYSFQQFVQNSVSRIILNGVFLTDTVIEIKTVQNDGSSQTLETIFVEETALNSPRLVGTKFLNSKVEKLEVGFYIAENNLPRTEATIAVHSIQILRPYEIDLFFGANVLYDFFETEYRESLGTAAFVAGVTNKNILVTRHPLSIPSDTKASLLAVLFFICVFFILRAIDWPLIPAFKDMSLGKDVSSAHEFGTINGVRGIAALLVLLSHSAPGFFSLGLGLAILFSISGFLLSKPFIFSPTRIYSFNNIELYITKRLKRILPVYYLYVFILYVVSLELDTALRHFLFVQAEGHLWPMTQIFAFYLMLPFVLLITSGMHRIHLLLPIVALCVASHYWLNNMTGWKPFFNGDYFHEFYLYAFLMGVAASYLHYGFLAQSEAVKRFFTRGRWLFAALGMALLFITIAWSAPIKPPAWFLPYISQFYVKVILSVTVLILALNIKGTLFNFIVNNWFFRSMGIIGFSFYIFHGLGMQIVLKTQQIFLGVPNPDTRSWTLFFGSLVVTYAISVFTYSYIERPFFGFKKPAQGKEPASN